MLGVESLRAKLLVDGISNTLIPLTAGVMSLVTVPFVMRVTGLELYGLWLVAMSMAKVLATADLGLGWSVALHAAAPRSAESAQRDEAFLGAAAGLLVTIGVLGVGAMQLLGSSYGGGVELSAAALAALPWFFLVAGALFALGLIESFLVALLSGLQRFVTINAVTSGVALLRGAGTIVLCFLPPDIAMVAIGAWWILTAVASVVALDAAVRAEVPSFALRPRLPRLSALRGAIALGLRGQLIQGFNGLTWQAGTLLTGSILGAARVVPFALGQSIPVVVHAFGQRVAEPLWPASGGLRRDEDPAELRALYETSVYLNLMFAAPVCVGCMVLAADFLRLWVGIVDPDAAMVMQILSLAVFLQAFSLGAEWILWGRGETRPLLLTGALVTVAAFLLVTLGLGQGGLVGAAAGLFVALTLGSVMYLSFFGRIIGWAPWPALRDALVGIGPALVAMSIMLVAIRETVGPLSLVGFASVCLLSAAVYGGALLVHGARPEHRDVVRAIAVRIGTIVGRA